MGVFKHLFPPRHTAFRWLTNPSGFTLIEMAIVVVIVGLIISVAAGVLPSLIAAGKIKQARTLLERADLAVRGYALANNRLPWADSNGDGTEDTDTYIGTLPFQTLGLPFQADVWGAPIKYAVYGQGVPPVPPNLAGTFGSTAAFCTEISLAVTSGFNPSIAYTTATPCGTSMTNQAYVVASGGLKDLDGANGRWDDCNSPGGAGFNLPGRIIDATYDDLVAAYSLNELNQYICSGGGGGGGAVEICNDAGGVDEDGDGLANCDDPDCAAHPACTGSTLLNITTPAIPGGTVNSSYTTAFAATGGTLAYAWNLTNNGGFSDFSLTASTLSGTLDQCPGNYTVAVQVQDSTLPGDGGPLSDSDSFTLQVTSDLAVNRTSGAGTAVTWSSPTQQETFQTSGGRLGSINWTLNSGGATGFSAISTGADTCKIRKTGNTTSGTYTFILTAADAACAGNTADITLTVTVTASGSGFPGNIAGVVDRLEFYTSNISDPDIIATSGTYFAIAFSEDSTRDGHIHTISIDGSGNISDGSETPFDTSSAYTPDIISVSGDVYAVAYEGPGRDGWLRTMTIDGSGTVSWPIDSLEFEPSRGEETKIIPVGGDIHAIVYRGNGSDGWIDTVSIQSDGTLSGPLDRWEYDTRQGRFPSIVPVSGNIFAVAYQGDRNDGWIKTLTIDGSGNIAPTGRSLEFDPSNGREPVMVHVSGDIFAVAYRGPADDGWMRTVAIDAGGNISGPVSSLEFDTGHCEDPDLINVAGEIFAVAYEGPGGDGWLKTVSIDAGGTITDTGSALEFDTLNGVEPSLAKVSDTMVAVAYSGSGSDGFVATISIE